jgi:peptidoglycan hydrolase CwlO-like protein
MKKKLQKNKSEKTFASGEVMSLLENMNDGIKILAEGQSDLRKDVNEIRGDINVIKNDIEIIKSDITDIKFDLKRKVSYDEFEKLENRVVKLEKLSFAR